MEKRDYYPILESILFTMGKSVEIKTLAEALKLTQEEIKQILQDMAKEKRIKGILLDVLNSEPPLPDDLKIIENDNVLLTPHICGATYEVTDHQSDIITERLKAWKKQEQLERIVYNYHSLKMPL